MEWDIKTINSAMVISAAAMTEASTAAFVGSATMIGDEAAILAMTAGMIVALSRIHDKPLSMDDAMKWLLPNMGVFIVSRAFAMSLKWIPIAGAVANASITFAATQIIGWTVYLIFKDDKDLKDVSAKEVKIYKDKAEKMKKPDVNKWASKMPEEEKAEYDTLVEKLRSPVLTEDERKAITKKMQDLVSPYIA